MMCPELLSCLAVAEDYEQLVEDIVRDGRLYASENHQEILKVSTAPITSIAWHCWGEHGALLGVLWG